MNAKRVNINNAQETKKHPSTSTAACQRSRWSRQSTQLSRASSSDRGQSPVASAIRNASKVHQPGQLPPYLRQGRPDTTSFASSRLQLKLKPSTAGCVGKPVKHEEPEKVFRVYDLKAQESSTNSIIVLEAELMAAMGKDLVEKFKGDLDMQRECPPSEGSTQKELLMAKQQELAELMTKFNQLQEKYNKQDADVTMYQAQVKTLQDELHSKEVDLVVQRGHAKNLQRQMLSRETVSSEREARRQAELNATIVEKDNFISELMEKLTSAGTTTETLKRDKKSLARRVQDLCSEMENLRREQERNTTRLTEVCEKEVQTVDAEDSTVATSGTALQHEQENIPAWDDQQRNEDVEFDTQFNALFAILAEKKRQSYEEKKVLRREMRIYHQRKSVRSELLQHLHQLRKEEHGLKEIVKANYANYDLEDNEDKTLKEQICAKIRKLLPITFFGNDN